MNVHGFLGSIMDFGSSLSAYDNKRFLISYALYLWEIQDSLLNANLNSKSVSLIDVHTAHSTNNGRYIGPMRNLTCAEINLQEGSDSSCCTVHSQYCMCFNQLKHLIISLYTIKWFAEKLSVRIH